MKRPPAPTHENTRFSGALRHYHRTNVKAPRTWDDWIEGTTTKTPSKRKWAKIIGITVCILVLCGIVYGLIIELS